MTALVVGAGPGLGLAIARALGAGHDPIGLIARRPENLAALVASLAGDGIAAGAFPGDISDDASLRGAIADARENAAIASFAAAGQSAE